MFNFFKKEKPSSIPCITFKYRLTDFEKEHKIYNLQPQVPQRFIYAECEFENVDIHIARAKYEIEQYDVTIYLHDSKLNPYQFKKEIIHNLLEKMPQGFTIVG